MALKYKLQTRMESLAATWSYDEPGPLRYSSLRQVSYGGRGGMNDELEYIRNNGSGTSDDGVNEKLSDASVNYRTFFSNNNGVNRADEINRVAFETLNAD